MIIQATTPTISIKVDNTNLNEFKEIVLVLLQSPFGTIEKKRSNGDIIIGDDESTLSCSLSQEETRKLKESVPLEMQLRVKDNDGNVSASNIIKVNIGKSLSLEVIWWVQLQYSHYKSHKIWL